MVLDIALLGTGGMQPLPGRWLASTLIRYGSHLVLFDCGEGTQISLRALAWGIKDIDLILISHVHGDHIGGLPGLLLSLGNAGRTEPVQIVGPLGLQHTVDSLRVIARYLPFPVHCREVSEPANLGLDLDGLIGRVAPADHAVPCLAYRLEVPRRPAFNPDRARALDVPIDLWGKLQHGQTVQVGGRTVEPSAVLGSPRRGVSVGLITDTRPSDELVSLVRGCDVLICEGMYGDSAEAERAAERKHMTFAEAAQLAASAGVGQLILTHFSPSMPRPEEYLDQARRVFPNSVVGRDHLTLTLRFE